VTISSQKETSSLVRAENCSAKGGSGGKKHRRKATKDETAGRLKWAVLSVSYLKGKINNMKNTKVKIFSLLGVIYILVGLYFWWIGGGWIGPFPENIFTFLYVVFLWPFVIGIFILFN